MLLEAHNLERVHAFGNNVIKSLSATSLMVDSGDFLVITGPSGSGKSTLLNLLSGLDRPTSGDVLFDGRSLSEMRNNELAHLRNTFFGFIFQTPHLLPHKNILENTMLPLHYMQEDTVDDGEKKCMQLLEYLGLASAAKRYPNTLSGGERQRVVFARALCLDPQIIFADEPTGSLDGKNSEKILELLAEQANGGRTVVMVSHDPEAIKYGKKLITLEKFI